MSIEEILTIKVKEAVLSIYNIELPTVELQPTLKDFVGDITVVVFPVLRFVKGNPELIGNEIGKFLKDNLDEVASYNAVKGFLNITINDAFYLKSFNKIKDVAKYGYITEKGNEAVMVEYSSPNTNKTITPRTY